MENVVANAFQGHCKVSFPNFAVLLKSQLLGQLMKVLFSFFEVSVSGATYEGLSAEVLTLFERSLDGSRSA